MAGMTFSFFQTGEVQPLLGVTIARPLEPGQNASSALSGIALRDMADPELDGKSINYVDNFTTTFNPHYSSGVPNKVSGCPTELVGTTVQVSYST